MKTPPKISQAEILDSKKPVETGIKGNVRRGAKYQTIPTVGQIDKEQLQTGKSEMSVRLHEHPPTNLQHRQVRGFFPTVCLF